MEIVVLDKCFMPKEDFVSLMKKVDRLFTPPISQGIDLEAYSEKLHALANFVVCREEGKVKGFTAFYKNEAEKQLYITLICVDRCSQKQGLGSKMLDALSSLKSEGFCSIGLEVSKANLNAYQFYKKHDFVEQEDRGKKFLMGKSL